MNKKINFCSTAISFLFSVGLRTRTLAVGDGLHQKDYLVLKIQIMLTNLSKSFCFKKNENNYSVDYIFKNEPIGNSLSLVVDVSRNDEEKVTHTVNKPTATLYQSNELIEKMITDEIVLFSN